MGHKVHPIGLRLGIHRKWKSNWYFDSKNYSKFLHLNFDIEKYFKGFLYFYPIKTLLINCQIIKLPSNQIFIFIFFYRLRRKFKKIKNNFWKTKRWKYNLEKSLINKSNKENIPFIYSQNLNNKEILNYCLKNIFLNKIYIKNNLNKKNNKIINNLNKIFLEYKLNLKLNKILNKINLYNKYNILLLKNTFKLNFLFKLNIMNNLLLNNFIKNNLLINFWIKNVLIYLNKNKVFFNQYNYIYILNKNYKNTNFFYLNKKNYLNDLKNNNKLFPKKTKGLTNVQKLIKLNKNHKKKHAKIFFKKELKITLNNLKQFLSKITNSKINLIFINSLSFCKYYYYTQKKKKKKKQINERYNIWPLQRFLFNRYKYSAIYIKDFIHLSFIAILIKNPQILVNFIGHQFKHLPKNRKQLKLLSFITQTIKILCEQRREIIGFKLQIKGRLNRRNRTKTYNFKKGTLPIQTTITRIEYAYSEGFTRSGLIGIKLWLFYDKIFKNKLKKKFLEYFLYSKYKLKFNFNLFLKKYIFLKNKKLNNSKIYNKKNKLFKNINKKYVKA